MIAKRYPTLLRHRRWFSLLVVGCCSWTALAGGPRLTVDAPHFNFGEQPNHLTIEHTFEVRNDGDAPLEIERIRSSCGCTVGAVSQRRLAPGETATITAHYRLTGRRGNQYSVLTLETNDPVNPHTRLIMSGYALQEMVVQPAHLFFGEVTKDAVPARTIQIRGEPHQPFSITRITMEGDGFSWDEPMTIAPHDYHLTVTVSDGGPAGALHAALAIHTTHPDYPVLTVPLRANRAGPLNVAPAALTLVLDPDRSVTRFVVVRPGTVQDFEITEVQSPIADVDVRLVRLGTGGYRIQLTNLRGLSELAGQPLRIYTTAEAMPVIEVPFDLIQQP